MTNELLPICPACKGHEVKLFTGYGIKGSDKDRVKSKEIKTWRCLGCKHQWPATE
jgi:hypothetical protein